MKKMNRLIALALVLVMALALTIPAFAAQGGDGTLDIDKAKKGEEYSVYRVLDLDYVKGTTGDGSFSYTVEPDFIKFFKDNMPETYIDTHETIPEGTVRTPKNSFDASGNPLPTAVFYFINNITEFKDGNDKALSMTWLASALAQYVSTNKVVRDSFVKCETEGSAKINNLLYGYYLMVPSGDHTSAMFSLTSAIPNASIENKSQYPTPEKTLKDADETTYAKANTAAIGETVDFKITGKVPNMTAYSTYKFVITDTMPNFTYVDGSAKLKIGGVEINKDNYLNLSDGNTSNTLVWDDTDKTLTVTIPDLKKFGSATAGADIELTYQAKLTESTGLVIGGKGNENTVKFTYSNNPNTDTTADSTTSKTTTFALQFKLDKVDAAGKHLTGATWKLEKKTGTGSNDWTDVTALTGGKPVFAEETTGTYQYNGAATPTTNGDGVFTWTGIDQGTYRLTETAAPAGHVRIENPIEFSISSTGVLSNNTADGSVTLTATMASTGGHPSVLGLNATGENGVTTMRVQNVSQSALPSTGGAGLYVVAGVALLALLAFGGTALLKKRVTE